MTAGGMEGFRIDDLAKHRSIQSLAGGTQHDRLVFVVSGVRPGADAYRSRLYTLQASSGERARALTHPAFGASSPVLDPAGKRVAFLTARGGGAQQVHVLPLDGGEARPVSDTQHQLGGISAWSPDGKRLLVTAKVRWGGDLGGEERADDDGSRDGERPKVVTFLPYKLDGSGVVLGHRTHLFAVDVDSGEMKALVEGDFDVDDGEWSPDGSQLMFLRGRGGEQRHRNDLWLADADGTGARQATDSLASIKHAAWSPDGRTIAIAAGDEAGDATTYLFLLDVASGRLRRLGDEDFEIDAGGAPQWHPDGSRIAVVALRRGLQRVAVVNVASGGHTLLGRGLRHVETVACCGDRLAVAVASVRLPVEVHVFGWDGSDERRLTAFNRGWMRKKQRPHVAKRRFEVPDGDGGCEHVEAWVLRPQGEGPFPVLVDMHGGPHSHVLLDFAAHVYWYLLVSRGWMVVAPNAVGSSGYGKAFRERLRGHWGELDLPQVLAIVEALQRQGEADARVACAGKSYGGFLSAWAIGDCDTFKAAVVSAPVANVESHAGTSDSGFYVTPWMIGGELSERRERFRDLSPTNYCEDVRTPTLLLQGDADERCPLGQSEEMFAGLVRCASIPVQMVVYPGGSHGMAKTGKPSHRRDYHQRIVDWVEAHANASGT